MDTITSTVSARGLRNDLADVMGRVRFASERVAVTRHGKVAAVLISPDDLELLEELEAAADLAAYHSAKQADDGVRVSLDQLRRELGE
ncbi:MAG: type II toxin-antitoxin system Phd/YefM family antitoxin [Propionibacteriaceae bacterium]|nr:type II toxin-antitoxin system Phd/YefM family antitoxin [Propionibacteriaceae bacterium]